MDIDFTDYDRITDTLYWLSSNITLNFTVTLSKGDKFGKRNHFHYESEYQSKYSDVQKARSIKRNMNFYFTLDNKNDFANGFILRPQDIYFLSESIKKIIYPWFFGDSRIYGIVDDKLYIKGTYVPLTYAQNDYKYISFVPIIFKNEDGSFREGIHMYLNNESEFADMDIDKFFGFYQIISTTDMYSVACSLINYVKIPPHGVNIFRPVGLGSGGGITTNDNWNDNKPVSAKNFLNNLKSK